MCLAVYEEYVTKSNQSQFIMIDSDTIIPSEHSISQLQQLHFKQHNSKLSPQFPQFYTRKIQIQFLNLGLCLGVETGELRQRMYRSRALHRSFTIKNQ